MTDALSPSSRRVRETAESLNLSIAIREMPQSTRTAEEAAAACRCEVSQIVKSLVFEGASSGTPYLLLVSGKNRVDQEGVAHVLGEALTRPNAAKVRAWTGYAIGGIPPFGHDTLMKTFIDEDLLAYDIVWAAAGNPQAVFSVSPRALADAVKASTIRIA